MLNHFANRLVITALIGLAPLALAEAPLYGIMMVVKGDIKIYHPSNQIEVAKVGSRVTAGDSVEAGPDSRAKIVMSDKNVLNISPDSKIKIENHIAQIYTLSVPKYPSSDYKWNINEPNKILEGQGSNKIKISIKSKTNCTVNVIERDSICIYNYESLILK